MLVLCLATSQRFTGLHFAGPEEVESRGGIRKHGCWGILRDTHEFSYERALSRRFLTSLVDTLPAALCVWTASASTSREKFQLLFVVLAALCLL